MVCTSWNSLSKEKNTVCVCVCMCRFDMSSKPSVHHGQLQQRQHGQAVVSDTTHLSFAAEHPH